MADAMELSKQVHDICGNKTELRAFLDAHPQVSVTKYRDGHGIPALHKASERGDATCVRMLLDQGADVHARDDYDRTALILVSMRSNLKCMQILIEAKADVNASNTNGRTAAHYASCNGNTKCLQLLIDNHADLDARDEYGETPAIYACGEHGCLSRLQLLVDNKADLSVRGNEGRDALTYAIGESMYIPEAAFPVLCCNTDAKNVKVGGTYGVTEAEVAACIEEYKHIQAYIDEYHRALKNTLSDEVEVDVRVGRGGKGVYQEPLERVLEYLGMSMHKDQVVNASIDGGVKRALIPFHVLNAKGWFDSHRKEQQRAQLRAEQSMHQAKASMHLDKANALQIQIDAVFA
jgi:predicted nucleic acid-binding Zn finger protein